MWSGTRSVGTRTIPSGKRPISSIGLRVGAILGWPHDARGVGGEDDGRALIELELGTQRPLIPPSKPEVTAVIRSGDTLANEITGETITFLETAADTNGEYTLIEVTVAPGGGVPMAHVHPNQSETFEVVAGRLSLKAGRDRLEAEPGGGVTIATGPVDQILKANAEPA